LIESRLNCDDGHYETLAQWCRILAVLIPKVSNPTKVGEWRPISLTSVLQKLYLAVVQQVCEPLCSPLDDALFGFRANCQTGDISEAVRIAVQKRFLHNHQGYFLKADAFRAFDSMRHCFIEEALVEAQAPAQYICATMTELSFCTVDLSYQGELIEGIPFCKGGRQGATDTPTQWNRLFGTAISRARRRWRDMGLGMRFCATGFSEGEAELVLDAMVWADDTIIAADTLEEMRSMFGILTEEMRKLSLTWKPKSLELLRVGGKWSDKSFCWESCVIALVEKFTILGVCVDSAGSDTSAFNHRESVCWSHWFERQSILEDRRIPLRLRWKRCRETVERTFLHGAGAWAMTEERLGRLDVLERKLLKRTLKYKQFEGMTEQEFHIKLNTKVTQLIKLFDWVPLSEVAVKLNCGWLGHVARRPDSVYSRLLSWKGVVWRLQQLDAGFKLGYRRAGRPIPTVEENIVRHIGPFYREFAEDRRAWADVRRQVAGAREGLTHYSNRMSDMLLGRRRLCGNI
jgi:hypothetical protein